MEYEAEAEELQGVGGMKDALDDVRCKKKIESISPSKGCFCVVFGSELL